MPSVYLETTIPSYLAAPPSRDLIVAAHQQITHEWWLSARHRFDLYVSEVTLDEISFGRPKIADERLALVQDLPVLRVTSDVLNLIQTYEQRLGLQGRALADVPHFAFAVAYNMEYLVTWNCAHIANGRVIQRLQQINTELGRLTPIIVTPEELLTSEEDDEL